MASLEDLLVTLISTQWNEETYSPKPTIDNILDYDSKKDIPAESITIIPFFQTVLMSEALEWREWNYICEVWVNSVTGKTNIEDMLTEIKRIVDANTITGFYKLYVSDIKNISDKKASPKNYKIIFNLNCLKEETY